MLENEHIRLRAFEKADLLPLHSWENLSEHWRTSSTLAPYSLRNVMNYLAEYDADPFHAGELRLMIERKEDEAPLGFVELYDVEVIHRRSNVGLLIAPEHQRAGYGTQALNLLENYCHFRLNLHQLLAYVPRENIPSQRLFEKRGFRHVATLPQWLAGEDDWVDSLVYQKFLNVTASAI